MNPYDWANTPGLGRAPLLPDPVQPATVAQDPRRDLARLLLQGDGPTPAGDMPVGALVRDPASLTQAQQFAEMTALGGFPHEGRAAWTRAPSTAVTGMATLAGTGGLGLPAGYMAGQGVKQHQQRLANEFTQGIAEAMESGAQARAEGDRMFDAYEAGRQAARGYRPEREQRGGGDLSGSRGGLGSGNVSRGAGSDTLSGGRF